MNFLFFLVKCIYQKLLIKCQEIQFDWVTHATGKVWMEQIIWCYFFNKTLPCFSIHEQTYIFTRDFLPCLKAARRWHKWLYSLRRWHHSEDILDSSFRYLQFSTQSCAKVQHPCISPAYTFKIYNLNAQYSILPLWDQTQNSQAPEYTHLRGNINLSNGYQMWSTNVQMTVIFTCIFANKQKKPNNFLQAKFSRLQI